MEIKMMKERAITAEDKFMAESRSIAEVQAQAMAVLEERLEMVEGTSRDRLMSLESERTARCNMEQGLNEKIQVLESERQSKKGEIMSLLGSQERCQASIKELERSLVNSKQETNEAKQQLQE